MGYKVLYVAAVMVASAMLMGKGTFYAEAKIDQFFIEGRVYCDPCKVQFETRLSEYMAGAKVRLTCKNRNIPGEPVTLTVEEVTNNKGVYRIPVDGDHEEEICEIQLVKSGNEECKEPMDNGMQKSRVVLTKNVGMNSKVRFANSLGYMKKDSDDGCPDVLAEMGFLPQGDTQN